MSSALFLLFGLVIGIVPTIFLVRAVCNRGRISAEDHEVLRRQCQDAQTAAAVAIGRADTLVQQLAEKETANQSLLSEKEIALKHSSTLEAKLDAAAKRLEEQAAFVQSVKEEMQTAFGRLASQTLETNAERFGEAQRARLNDLLKPFREQIDGFRQDVSTNSSKKLPTAIR